MLQKKHAYYILVAWNQNETDLRGLQLSELTVFSTGLRFLAIAQTDNSTIMTKGI